MKKWVILQKVKQALGYLICFQMTCLPMLAYPAQSSRVSVADIEGFESSSVKQSIGAQSYQSGLMWKAIQAGQIQKLSDKVLDPHQLVRQYVSLLDQQGNEKQKLYFSDVEARIPIIQPTDFKFKIENGLFVVTAMQGESAIAKLVFSGIQAVTFASNADVVVILDQKGNMWSFLKDALLQNKMAFQSPIPQAQVFRSGQALGKVDSSFRMAFFTRGLSPDFVEAESLKQSGVIYPEDIKGEPLLKGENLFVYKESNGKRELAGIFAREHIYNQIRIATLHLAKLVFKTNLFGVSRSFEEKLQRVLQIDGAGADKSPLEVLIEEEEKRENERKDNERLEQRLAETLKGNSNVSTLLSKFSRQGLSSLLSQMQRAESLKEKNVDKVSFSAWRASFEKIVKQADEKIKEIERILATDLSEDQRIKLEKLKAQIEKEKRDRNFHDNQLELTKEVLSRKSYLDQFKVQEKSYLQKVLSAKNLRKIAVIGASIAGAHYGLQFVQGVHVGEIATSQTVYLAINWAYDFIPQVLLDAGYRKILLASFFCTLALIPLNELLALVLVKPLKGLGYQLQKLGSKGATLGKKIVESMESFESLGVYQRIVTIFARAYSYVIPYFEYMSSLTGQNAIKAMRAGLNPGTKIKGKSQLGQKIGLQPNESIRVGLNSPLKDPELLKKWLFLFPYSVNNPLGDAELRNKQNKGIAELSEQQKKAQVLAWTLATLTVSETVKIDPATLAEVQAKNITVEELAKIEKDQKLKGQWQQTARTMNIYLNNLLKQGEIDLSEIKSSDIERYYKVAMAAAKEISESALSRSGRLINTLKDLKSRFLLMGAPAWEAIGNTGVAEKEFLRSILTDKFVARRVELGLKSDIVVSNVIASTVGARADMSRPEFLVAQEGGFLFTNPQRWFEIVNNLYYAHLMSAASNKLLVFQSAKIVSEKAYQPIEKFLEVTARAESLRSGIISWLEIFDFKKSNIGAYYVKQFEKRMALAYVAIPLNAILRTAIGAQEMMLALKASIIFYFAATFSFGAPWMLLNRGAQLAENKVQGNRKRLEEKVQEITRALREGNHRQLGRNYEKLVDLYRASDMVAYRGLVKSLKSIEGWLGLSGNEKILFSAKMKNQMRRIFQKGEIEILLNGLAQLHRAKEANDLSGARQVHKELVDLLKAKEHLPEFKELSKSLELRAKNLITYAQAMPPVYTQTHPHIEKTLTFWGGAVFTTVLFLSLAVKTFTPDYLTWSNVGTWVAIAAIAHPLLQLAFGKTGYGWRVLNPIFSKVYRNSQWAYKKIKGTTNEERLIRARMCRSAIGQL